MTAASDVSTCIRSMPRTLKVGAYDWKVVILDGDEGLCGQAEFATRELRLWPANLTSPSHVVGITLHECLHVIYDNEKLSSIKRNREETIVLGFEAGLISLFRDNPRFLTWMKKWLK